MRQRQARRYVTSLLGALALLLGTPALAQESRAPAPSPGPLCQERPAEFQPRVELLAPPRTAARRERGRGIVVLNNRGFNYASGMPSPQSPPAHASPASPLPTLP